jgi:hypothetical protein
MPLLTGVVVAETCAAKGGVSNAEWGVRNAECGTNAEDQISGVAGNLWRTRRRAGSLGEGELSSDGLVWLEVTVFCRFNARIF